MRSQQSLPRAVLSSPNRSRTRTMGYADSSSRTPTVTCCSLVGPGVEFSKKHSQNSKAPISRRSMCLGGESRLAGQRLSQLVEQAVQVFIVLALLVNLLYRVQHR